MPQGFGLKQIKAIAERTAQRGDFLEFSKDAVNVLSGKKVPERNIDKEIRTTDDGPTIE